MQITQHVYNMHIDDGAASHPGGSNNFFVGDEASYQDVGSLCKCLLNLIGSHNFLLVSDLFHFQNSLVKKEFRYGLSQRIDEEWFCSTGM